MLFKTERNNNMATKEVKLREANGEDLSGITWTAEKPYMLVRKENGKLAISFFVSREDFDYAVNKVKKYGEEVVYAAYVEAFQKIDDYKSGFGRLEEIKVIEVD